jgi:hypothetical protein
MICFTTFARIRVKSHQVPITSSVSSVITLHERSVITEAASYELLFLSRQDMFVKFRMCTPNACMKEVNGQYSTCREGIHEYRIAMLHPGKIPEDATNEKRAPSFK